MLKVAVAQVGSVLFDTAATLLRVKGICEEAAAAGVRLVVFPEALLGGYPKGLDFGAVVGSRSEAGKAMFLRYFKGAVTCPGVETEMLAEWARRLGLHIVIGCDRAGWGDAVLHESAVFAGGVGGKTSEADADGDGAADLGDGRWLDDAGGGDGDWADRDGDLLGELYAAVSAASL